MTVYQEDGITIKVVEGAVIIDNGSRQLTVRRYQPTGGFQMREQKSEKKLEGNTSAD